MPVAEVAGEGKAGVAFLVSAGLVYEVIAAACSSPQTAEINAHQRADTLMKWVNIGALNAVAFVAIAAIIDPKHRGEIIAGGGLAAGLMYFYYLHAKDAGLRSNAPSTETTSEGFGARAA